MALTPATTQGTFEPVLFALEGGLAGRALFVKRREPFYDGYRYVIRDHPTKTDGRAVMLHITADQLDTKEARLGDVMAEYVAREFMKPDAQS